jgi:hypothetical protein
MLRNILVQANTNSILLIETINLSSSYMYSGISSYTPLITLRKGTRCAKTWFSSIVADHREVDKQL